MSSDAALTGKAKKAKRDEERRKLGKKRKRHQETQALPEIDNEDDELEDGVSLPAKTEPTSSKKRKHEGDEPVQTAQDNAQSAEPSTTQPLKKRRKAKSDTEGGDTTQTAKKDRFIVFVGNLPYTITKKGIEDHFAKIKPESIRHMTEPGTTKSKGFAFLEFANYDRMKTCLSLYHHTTIDSGVGGPKGIKKINVELTAGGGGKSANRQNKLKERNSRLQEQRKRKAEVQAKQDARKSGKGSKSGGKPGTKPDDKTKEDVQAGGDEGGIHPSRLARINAG